MGFPHSDTSGSMPACGSPKLFAACHVFHRLLVPRHPLYALSSLTIKSFGRFQLPALRSSLQIAPPLFASRCPLIARFFYLANLSFPTSIVKDRLSCQLSTFSSSPPAPAAAANPSLPCRSDHFSPPPSSRKGSNHPYRFPVSHLLVELIGFEPTTPWLQTRCSPN
jgi:hypothetical protein